MVRRLGVVDLSPDQLLEAVWLLGRIERAAADIARDQPQLDEIVGDIRMWLSELRALFGAPRSLSHALVQRRLLDEVEAIGRRTAA